MIDIACQLRNDTLTPFSEEDRESLREYKPNQIVRVKVKGVRHERSYLQLKMFWAACKQVAENTEDPGWATKDMVAEQVKIELRYIDYWMHIKGALVIKTKSISYKELPHIMACNLFDRAWPIMAKKIGITVEELLAEANKGKTE